jgi:tRNA(Ile)-lysidine synthase
LLSLPRAADRRLCTRPGLEWVDDESNADTGVKRNFIRRDIAPLLAAAFPGYPATLARAAAHQAEAALLHDDLARLDARRPWSPMSISG